MVKGLEQGCNCGSLSVRGLSSSSCHFLSWYHMDDSFHLLWMYNVFLRKQMHSGCRFEQDTSKIGPFWHPAVCVCLKYHLQVLFHHCYFCCVISPHRKLQDKWLAKILYTRTRAHNFWSPAVTLRNEAAKMQIQKSWKWRWTEQHVHSNMAPLQRQVL